MGLTLLIDTYDTEEGARKVAALAPRLRQAGVAVRGVHPRDHQSFASAHLGRAAYDTITLPYGEQILWPDHCVQGTAGADFHPELEVVRAELVLRKGFRRQVDSYSAFFENDRRTPTGLAGYLGERGFSRLFIAGLAFDYCVLWSAEDARRRGFEVVVIEDACRALDVEGSAESARRRLEISGARLASSWDVSRPMAPA
ncbi:MAG: isochorismatase family protein [Phenylobacterium sp.]|nr:isochorismatase family protein [Phenylobacterium sp.]